MLKIEQYEPETCELAPGSSFVLVRVPIRVVGEGTRSEAQFHYSVGSFVGRDTPLALEADTQITLRFRIPHEVFRAQERLVVEVQARSSGGPEKILWAKRWEITWREKTPFLEPIAD